MSTIIPNKEVHHTETKKISDMPQKLIENPESSKDQHEN